MSGPIVRTGTNPKFWANYDKVFGGKSAAAGKTEAPKAAKKSAAPKKAVKKASKKAVKKK